MTRWFDAKRERNIELFELLGSLTVLIGDGLIANAVYAELLIQFDDDDEVIDEIELHLDVTVETARKIAGHGGVLPFPPDLLDRYGDGRGVHIRLIMVANDAFLADVVAKRKQAVSLEEIVMTRGDNDYPAAFDLGNYTFRDMAELKAMTPPKPDGN